MTDTDFKNTVAKNIIKYRKQAGLTQLALAEKLNYSDKAVSKWERGESLPDVFMLYTMAEIFGVTLNDLADVNDKRTVDYTPQKKKKHRLITAMSIGLVWLTMSIGFMALKIIDVKAFDPALLFMYGVPISFIVALVFMCIWWGIPSQAVCVSGIVWGVALSVYLSVNIENTVYIFLTAAILQVLTGLWFGLREHLRKSKFPEE